MAETAEVETSNDYARGYDGAESEDWQLEAEDNRSNIGSFFKRCTSISLVLHVTLASTIFTPADFGTPDDVDPVSKSATNGQQGRRLIPPQCREPLPAPPVTAAPPRSPS